MAENKAGGSKLYFGVSGLSCPDCALKIESSIKKYRGVADAFLDFSSATLTVVAEKESDPRSLEREITGIARQMEPGVSVKLKKQTDNILSGGNSLRLLRISAGLALFAVSFLPVFQILLKKRCFSRFCSSQGMTSFTLC
jgi:Cd2+/Zn2+-exporting ATPase